MPVQVSDPHERGIARRRAFRPAVEQQAYLTTIPETASTPRFGTVDDRLSCRQRQEIVALRDLGD